ncbi:MAG: 3-dehydroquinate synthase family protein [Saprospiraceae bacterium]
MKVISSSLCSIFLGAVHEGLQQEVDSMKVSALFVLCDENTKEKCVPKILDLFPDTKIIMVSSGERNKNIDACRIIWSALIKYGADRTSMILNVGGGVICDMGGFAAACYQRGIRFGHIPTTVMAMGDAAIGGKLGVDHDGFKNYVGLIQNPAFIWVDPIFIETLPVTEIRSGMSEVVKHAIIGSEKLWAKLEKIKSLETLSWNDMIEESISVKIKIVEKDLRENGQRKVLNFGHTIGHALESYCLTREIEMKHGHCVALGMLAESQIAFSQKLLNRTDFEAITTTIDQLLTPWIPDFPSVDKLLPWLEGDKKKLNGRVGFSLPDKIGSCQWDIPVSTNGIAESLDWLREHLNSVPFRLRVEKHN